MASSGFLVHPLNGDRQAHGFPPPQVRWPVWPETHRFWAHANRATVALLRITWPAEVFPRTSVPCMGIWESAQRTGLGLRRTWLYIPMICCTHGHVPSPLSSLQNGSMEPVLQAVGTQSPPEAQDQPHIQRLSIRTLLAHSCWLGETQTLQITRPREESQLSPRAVYWQEFFLA